jgi:hypothetical protein
MRPVHVTVVPSADVLSGAFLCNVNNLGHPPAPWDYDARSARCATSAWLPAVQAHCPRAHRTMVVPGLNWIRHAARTFQLSQARDPLASVLRLFEDEMQATVAAHGDAVAGFLSGAEFVRTEDVSFKGGVHGPGPYSALGQLLESAISAPPEHSPVRSLNPDGTLVLHGFPWTPMHRDDEYRVFVIGGTAHALSQQYCYAPRERAPPCPAAVNAVAFIAERVVTTWGGPDASAVADVWARSGHEDGPVVLELNPCGGPGTAGSAGSYSSGSALFHWTADNALLVGEVLPGGIHCRITESSSGK